MKFAQRVRDGFEDRRVIVFVRVLAVFLFPGAVAHLGSILGAGGTPWMTRPLLFRIADPLMLFFNLVAGWGLWRIKAWAVGVWILGLLLFQFIPFTFFIDAFTTDAVQRQILRGLLASHALFLGIYLMLLFRTKKRTPPTC